MCFWRLVLRKILIILCLVFSIITVFSFADEEENFSLEKDMYINGINCNKVEFSQDVILGDKFIYFPIDIDFLGNIGVFPLWNEKFNELYITASNKAFIPLISENLDGESQVTISKFEKRNIDLFIDGESRNVETIFNNQNGLYYAPVDEFLLDKLGWYYYDYGVGGKYIYTYKPNDSDFSLMKNNLEKYDLLRAKMMQINRSLEVERANYYIELIKNASDKYQIDELWIAAIIWQESNFEEDCEYKGATGLMQMMVSTGKTMGLTREDLLNPEINIEYCVRYLRNHINYYDGDLEKATLAYNQGTVRVDRGTSRTWYIDQVKVKYDKIKSYIEENRGAENGES